MANTRAQQNRSIRQQALREQLEAQGHLQHAIDIAQKLREPNEDTNVPSLKAAADIHMRLVDKYIPSLKAVEITGDGGDDIKIAHSIPPEVLQKIPTDVLAEMLKAGGKG